MDCKEIEKKKENSIKSPLNEINIKGYKYRYKDTYKKGICYRCIHHMKYKITILLPLEEYEKIQS